MQYDETQMGERVRTKSIDLTDLLECKLNEKSVENLPKGTDSQSVIIVSFTMIFQSFNLS